MGTDGNDGRTPGRVAENWGRQDRIRAGAVSGPWRSAPKSGAEPAAAPAAPPATAPANPPSAPPAVAMIQDAPRRQSVHARQDTGISTPQGGGATFLHRPRLVGVWIGVAVGIALALAIVGAAVLFRPSALPDLPTGLAAVSPPDAAEASVAPPVAEAPAAAPPVEAEIAPVPPPQASASIDGQGAIRLRVGPNLADAEREAISAALEGAGYGPVQVEVLPFPIAASRVGYYHPEDAEAAEALAQFVQGVLRSPGTALSTRDYSQLLQDAAPGRLDIWIEG